MQIFLFDVVNYVLNIFIMLIFLEIAMMVIQKMINLGFELFDFGGAKRGTRL